MKIFVITSYTPDSSSGYAWLAPKTRLVDAAALAGIESTSYAIVRLLEVKVPRKVRSHDEIQNYMDDLDAGDSFDLLPSLWENIKGVTTNE